ncbi:hypothetical protein VH1709_contig00039-0008 [Vibrio harveyi]|uniref:hypothetical protein n=1 Tax=Vibrio harveyi TaxID=669 RepID=UPI000D8B7337|nr:hypothetical protein [Vibrio harveyi]GBK99852.1 hypothetical protein VH1709_contig00039-0008 [Vibrio harveyi]
MINQNEIKVTLAGMGEVDCDVVKHLYRKNKQVALQLHAADTDRNQMLGCFPGEPMGTPTVCFPECKFKENETTIKNFDEYEGFLEALEQARVVRRTTRFIHTPNESYVVVEVLI